MGVPRARPSKRRPRSDELPSSPGNAYPAPYRPFREKLYSLRKSLFSSQLKGIRCGTLWSPGCLGPPGNEANSMVDVSSAKPMASPETSTAQRTLPAQPAGSAPLSFVATFSDVLQASLQGSAAPAAPGATAHPAKTRAGSLASPATSGAPALSDSAPAATLPNPLLFQFPWGSAQEALAQPAALSLSVAAVVPAAEPATAALTAATSSGSPLRQPDDPRNAAATPFDGTEEEITAPGASGSASAVLFPRSLPRRERHRRGPLPPPRRACKRVPRRQRSRPARQAPPPDRAVPRSRQG